jgi:hypothetical protein
LKAPESNKLSNVVCIASGEGVERLVPVARKYKEGGSRLIVILGGELELLEREQSQFSPIADELFLSVSNEAFNVRVGVVNVLKDLLDVIEKSTHTQYPDMIHAIVSVEVGQQISELIKGCNIKTAIENF